MDAGNFGDDVDPFGDIAELQFKIEAQTLGDFDGDAGPAALLKARAGGGDFVFADGKVQDDVSARLVGGRLVEQVGPEIARRDFYFRGRSALGVCNGTRQRAERGLGKETSRSEEEAEEEGKCSAKHAPFSLCRIERNRLADGAGEAGQERDYEDVVVLLNAAVAAQEVLVHVARLDAPPTAALAPEAFSDRGVSAILVVEAAVFAATALDEDFVLQRPEVCPAAQGQLGAEEVTKAILHAEAGNPALLLAETMDRGNAADLGHPLDLLPEPLFGSGAATVGSAANVGVAEGEEKVRPDVVIDAGPQEQLRPAVFPTAAQLAIKVEAPVFREAMVAEITLPAADLGFAQGGAS